MVICWSVYKLRILSYEAFITYTELCAAFFDGSIVHCQRHISMLCTTIIALAHVVVENVLKLDRFVCVSVRRIVSISQQPSIRFTQFLYMR